MSDEREAPGAGLVADVHIPDVPCLADPPAEDDQPTGKTCTVAGIVKNGEDGRGETITQVFFKRTHYAIYLAGGKVIVQYADEEKLAEDQIKVTAELIPLREQLHFLADKYKGPCYLSQVAEALRLGLEGQSSCAKAIMQYAMDDVRESIARLGRLTYLKFAIPMGLAGAALAAAAAGLLRSTDAADIALATAGGAVGALLSIVSAIRNRTVALDVHQGSNVLDAAARLLVGIISAGFLFLILTSGMVPEVKVGEAALVGTGATWRSALIVGFAAGFLERLLPDLLSKGTGEAQAVREAAAAA